MRGHRMSRRGSRRSFRRNAGYHVKNTRRVMRGGYRI